MRDDADRGQVAGGVARKPRRRNALVEQFAPLIRRVAYRLLNRLPANVEIDDLMSAGVIGLIDAAERFDPERTESFARFAEIRIRGAMVDELRAIDWVPRSVRQKSAALDAATRELLGRLGRPPTQEEIAAEMGLTLSEFYELARKAQASAVVSVEDIGGEGGRRDFLESIAAPEDQTPEADLEQRQEREIMMRGIGLLPERQRIVLSLYYLESFSLREIGNVLGVTESRVSQVHSAALARLRPMLTAMMPS